MEKVARYINAEFPGAQKVVEVGVGERDGVACSLASEGYDVTVTDVREVETSDTVRFVRNDVTQPDISVYEGADLIYSLRPPYELHDDIDGLAREVGAHLIIVPLGDEGVPSVDAELVNYEGRALFVRRV